MGHYHNLLDKKYFHKSVYIKKWEEAFNVKIKDYPLQYELVFETYNTLIKYNNILFSKNYITKSKKVDKIINLLNDYLNTYKNKINKSFDSQCIRFYYNYFEYDIIQLKEMKELYEKKGKKYNLTSFEEEIENIIFVLEQICFDFMLDSKEFPYRKNPNDKLPKLVVSKIHPEPEQIKSIRLNYDKQKKQNDYYINNYFDKTGIDLTQDKKQRDIIFEIHLWIEEINNALVNFIQYQDINKLNFFVINVNRFISNDFTFLEDIYYKNIIHRFGKILALLYEGHLNKAYDEIYKIIKENDNLYERCS